MTDSADKDQKTEEPTGKRISDARQEGNLPISRELGTFIMVVVVFFILMTMIQPLAKKIVVALRVFIEKPEQISLQDGGFQDVLMGVAAVVALPASAVFLTFFLSGILATMLQTNFYVGAGKLKFDLNRLNPISGFKKIFSMNAITELIKSFIKMVVLGWFAYIVISDAIEVLPNMAEMSLMYDLVFLYDKIVKLLIYFLLVLVVVAVGDTLYVRYQYFKELRMTKQEVKDEYKQMEGDPLIRAKLREIRMEKARKRMMANVPNADVIVVNPTHYSVALKYNRDQMSAPVVTAKGVDNLALRIREVAEENDVPLVSNPTLSRALYDTADLDEPIDPEHYRAVAEVISYVYKLKNPNG